VWWMPWHREAMKDVATCDKPRVVGSKFIRGFPNGETPPGQPRRSPAEYIGRRSEPRELKHLSTWRKREQYAIPLVAASESGRAQTASMLKAISVVLAGLWDMIWNQYGDSERLQNCHLVEHVWISQAIEGDSPVNER